MGITTKQCDSFLEYVISDDLLCGALDWIKDNLKPEDVFTTEQLLQWSKESRGED